MIVQFGAQYKTLTYWRTSSERPPRWLKLYLFSLKQRRLRQDQDAVFSYLMKIIEKTKLDFSWRKAKAKGWGAVDMSYSEENSNVTLGKLSQWKSTLKEGPRKGRISILTNTENGTRYEPEQLNLTLRAGPALSWGLNQIISSTPTEPKFLCDSTIAESQFRYPKQDGRAPSAD